MSWGTEECDRLPNQIPKFAPQEKNWLSLHPALPGLVSFENRTRTRAKGTMVKKDNIGSQKKEVTQTNHYTAPDPG